MSVLNEAADLVKARLGEIEEERLRLERALHELGGTSNGSGSGNSGRKKPGPKPGRKQRRRQRGKLVPVEQREAEIISFVKANPDVKNPELAKQLGVTTNYLSGVLLTSMKKKGKIRRGKDGKLVVPEHAEKKPTGAGSKSKKKAPAAASGSKDGGEAVKPAVSA